MLLLLLSLNSRYEGSFRSQQTTLFMNSLLIRGLVADIIVDTRITGPARIDGAIERRQEHLKIWPVHAITIEGDAIRSTI